MIGRLDAIPGPNTAASLSVSPIGHSYHRDTHGADLPHEQYKKLLEEHRTKNRAYKFIIASLPARMKKPLLDSDGDAVLDNSSQPKFTAKDKHRPKFKHLGDGRYEFVVPGIDEATYCSLAAILETEFRGDVALLKDATRND
jgi:hypothetical protein